MATIVSNLKLADFERQYNHDSDVAYEFWYGEAIPKATPAWLHGLVQLILGQLLSQAGFIPGAEVELRIVSQARSRPDIIAARNPLPADENYPTTAVDIVIEIVSKAQGPPDAAPKIGGTHPSSR